MRKIVNVILTGVFLFLFQNCSYDEEVFEENTKLTEEFNGKSFSNNPAISLEGCEIEYTFNNPYLTPAEKAAIRNSYPFFLSYAVVDYDTEIWYVDCTGYYDYIEINPGCDGNGCYIQTSGCSSGSCGSTPPKDPDPVDDPFGPDEY